MKLSRIVAERFGSLRALSLGELGDGLTVVLGPNEAGKTSLTTLVRYVLYGYPTKRDSEPGYRSDAGERLARLVFADGRDQWAIERAEGAHGGLVALHTLQGPDRPDLLAEIKSGVSRDAFRVVFGFGLDEMVQIETGRGDGLDILSRLYAATAGLGVSPSDVRAALKAEAGESWSAGGRKRELNLLKTRATEVKRQITDLETLAASFAQEQIRLAGLTEQLSIARSAREEATTRASELAAAAQKLADLESRIAETVEESASAQAALDTVRDKLLRVDVDEALVAIAAELDVVLGDLSAFRAGLRRSVELHSEAEGFASRAEAVLVEAGVDADAARAVELGPETTAGVERWKGVLANLESQATASRRAAESARDAARIAGAQQVAAGVSRPGRGSFVLGALMIVLGIAVAAVGIISADYVQVVLGLLVAGTGVVLVARLTRGPGDTVVPPTNHEELSQSVQLAAAAADRDAVELSARRAEWSEWLAAQGLGIRGDDPAAVSIVLDTLREHASLLAESKRIAEASRREVAECELYRQRLVPLAEGIVPELASAPLEDVPLHAARVRESLDAALQADRTRNELTLEVETLQGVIAHAERRLATARAEHSSVLERHGLPGQDAVRLAAEAVAAREIAREATEDFDALSSECTALSTRLNNQERDDAMGRLRLELAGIEERREAARERYDVLAVAEALMARTQAYNEQARQPVVVQRASELFEMITGGRYVRVSVPSDGGAFIVFDADSRPRPSSELSTGTAQQLYLAMRIALIESLGTNVGVGLPVLMDDVLVNFDPGRKRGAARAIAHLAAHRQVVLFTCHPETAELMREIAPDHTPLALECS